MAREVELKLEIDRAAADRLRSHRLLAGDHRVQRQISVYFDTPKGKLRRQGWVLRVRQHDEGWVQTVKRSSDAAGLFDRDEWETAVSSLQPDLQGLGETPLKELVGPRQFRHLVPRFRTDVERTTWLIESRGAEIELSHDVGLIEAGDARDPIEEIELELKQGDVDGLFGTARLFARQVPIRLGVSSKSERGFTLAAGRRDVPAKAVHAVIRFDAIVAEGFAAVAGACLKHFRLNEPLLLRTADAEAMHQVRVAIRRLRTALWLFRPAVRDKEFAAINSELRKLTRELGAARNIDVILASMSPGDPARTHLERDRQRLYARILRMLDSRRFRLFLLDLLAWANIGEWRKRKKAQGPLAPFAGKRLDKLWNQINERGAKLLTLSVEERHELRIDAKKMRYALEFLGGVAAVAGEAQRDFVKAAEGIQDALGHLNDLAMRQGVMAWGVPDSEKEIAGCLRIAKRHLRQMAKIGPFWSGA